MLISAQAILDTIKRREPAQPEALQLVAITKAYSGLIDEVLREIDRVIRATTLENFGPVRSTKPSLVFEFGFEGINHSPHQKSGIAVRFPTAYCAHPKRQATARNRHIGNTGGFVETERLNHDALRL